MFSVLLLSLVSAQANAPYNRTHTADAGVHCLWWPGPSVTFAQSVVGNPTSGMGVFDAVSASFGTWAAAMTRCGDLDLTEGPRTTVRKVGADGANVVMFRLVNCSKKVAATHGCWDAGTCGNDFDCWDHSSALLGVTTVSYDTATGRIVDADIELDAANALFTTVSQPVCGAKQALTCVASDVQNTMTHEVGHFLGLSHTIVSGSTMNATASLGETSKRTLDTGTNAFVCEVYTKGLAPKDCVVEPASAELGTAAPEPTGCDATGGLATWALLGVVGLGWRRRRALAVAVAVLASVAGATTMVALDLDALTSGADAVLHARVRSVKARWSGDHRRIITDVELEVLEAWKGGGPGVVVTSQPGGELDGLGQHVEGLARFTVGEEVVVFLEAQGPAFKVEGLQQGVFHVRRGPGVEAAVRQEVGEVEYVDAVSGAAVRKAPLALSLGALRDRVLSAGLQSVDR